MRVIYCWTLKFITLLPKSYRHYLQPTAEKLNISVDLTEAVSTFFYSELRKALIDMKGYHINVDNFGMFRAKTDELPKIILKYTKHLNALEKSPYTFSQMGIKKDLEIRLEKALRLKKIIDEETNRKKEFYNQK